MPFILKHIPIIFKHMPFILKQILFSFKKMPFIFKHILFSFKHMPFILIQILFSFKLMFFIFKKYFCIRNEGKIYFPRHPWESWNFNNFFAYKQGQIIHGSEEADKKGKQRKRRKDERTESPKIKYFFM